MNVYTASNARQNFFQLIKDVSESHEPAHIVNKDKKIVMMSEEDYNAIQETLYLLSIPNMRKSIQEGIETPLDECTQELDWDK